ncbi:MAG: 3-hydroxyacyl-CoA dehydrogenase [Cyanobacteriota bacterium erpe_2018_sw_39hr_WHONDRS-SW48-000098_B_bin.30]|jgi:3-hydroxyacyl-CoA dehydrogenase/enoyl-CoA hydratase/3-hydroxybutyryl-CoA epimerase|nr:3-hydroxyacyl-CoA dehydrogenase [Cyanobacteriota bacterium erpe_2018_sw_39hr_WHONDRS-SW48-000098_B_bin.30]
MAENLIDTPYKPGQCVMCKVEGIEPGGYSAVIMGTVPPSASGAGKSHVRAFLPSSETLKIGQTVPATFVCMHNSRALMTFAYMMGTTEKIQKSTAPDDENAFAIWVDSYPSSQKTRRAIDLIMPALSGKLLHELKCSQAVIHKLFDELTLANFTGCIKARNEVKKSRSAMIIINGRVCGAIYGRKDAHETFAVQQALKLMREDMCEEETFLQVYELPIAVVYSMSALFLGCPIQRVQGDSISNYIDTSLMSMSLASETGCLTYSADGKQTDSLIFVHEGTPFAGYEIETQKLIEDVDVLIGEIKTKEEGQMEAHLLPEQLLSDSVKLGYKLQDDGAEQAGSEELTTRQIHQSDDFIVDLDNNGVAFVWFNCQSRANTLGTNTLHQLKTIVTLLQTDDSIKGVVIASSKPDHFVFGADLHEIMSFDSYEQAYTLSSEGQLTFNDIAALKKPVVAAIHGACLGGGLEGALCAHRRVAATDANTLIGLPEVKIGLMPGLGGTQRLPQLIAVKSALEFILTAEPVSAERAFELGIVQELTTKEQLFDRSRALVMELINGTAPEVKAKEAEKPEVLKKLFATMERSFRIRFKGHYPAPLKAIEAVKLSQESDMMAGLDFEARSFAGLSVEGTSRNLIQIFFSQDFISRSAARQAEKHYPKPPAILGIVGSGIMGSELVKVARLVAPDMQFRVKSTTAERAADFKSHYADDDKVQTSDDLAILADADLVVEAIVEDTEQKQKMLAAIEKHVSDECTIATNTSSLELIKLGQEMRKPDRFVGLHFFYPVDKMQCVEVISHPSSSAKSVAKAISLVTAMGKTPISVKDSAGFLVNRLLCTHLLEAARLLDDGVPLNWIEDAAVAYGMPMGPFTLIDTLGLHLCFSVADQLQEAFGERFISARTKDITAKENLDGKAGGKGIYLWDESGRKLKVNDHFLAVSDLKLSDAKPSEEQVQQIQDQLFLPVLDEAARCLEEKVIRKPRELDLAMVVGTGYPAFRGGPLRYADQLGIGTVLERLKKVYGLSKSAPNRQPSKLLLSMQESGRRFYSSKE